MQAVEVDFSHGSFTNEEVSQRGGNEMRSALAQEKQEEAKIYSLPRSSQTPRWVRQCCFLKLTKDVPWAAGARGGMEEVVLFNAKHFSRCN